MKKALIRVPKFPMLIWETSALVLFASGCSTENADMASGGAGGTPGGVMGGMAGSHTGGAASPSGGGSGAATGGVATTGEDPRAASGGDSMGEPGGAGGHVDVPMSEHDPREICPPGPFDVPLQGVIPATELALDFVIEGEITNVDLEGPVWSESEGALFVSDKNAPWELESGSWQDPRSASIWKLVPGEQPVLHVAQSGSNGIALTLEGDLLAATHSNRNLTVFSASSVDTAIGVLLEEGANDNEGTYNSPNDVAVSSSGIVYFTDPTWQNSSDVKPAAAAYFITREGVVEAFDTFSQPNGISLSPDESTLYVGNNSRKVRKYHVGDEGRPVRDPEDGYLTESLSGRWSDGFAIDCAGNVYVTVEVDPELGIGGVDVLSPSGVLLGQIDVGGTATNAAFGGPEGKTLYITRGRGGIYSIDLPLPGYPY